MCQCKNGYYCSNYRRKK